MTGKIDTRDLYFRIKTIEDCLDDKLSQKDVSELLKITPRQVRRLVKKYREEGKLGLLHRLTTRPSNHSIESTLRLS
ncbi:hypothetical protein FACS1894152_3430 [Bacilli bacterium]|nr:hypothetical protein FACS1894152_3430 [Bacilli bacterium]